MKTLILPEVIKNNTSQFSFYEQLQFAKNRVDLLEKHRVQHSLRNNTEEYQLVFKLLPALIHYNFPELPAYVRGAPHGIYAFEKQDLPIDCISQILPKNFQLPEHKSPSVFDGMYVMGSIGSITQTSFSDLDIWLCYSTELSEEQLFLLNQKLEFVKYWAQELNVEVNFYLMNPKAFKAYQYHSDVTEEHNGSAQHFFLLDEFYRSAIRLAGKRILWLHVPESKLSYQKILDNAVKDNQLNLDEWVDFGDFSSLALGEYFGASLWQLYKGIESPHKSAIKILLLESYAENYAKTNLISKKFKNILLSEKEENYHFDPYLEMLDMVTEYLTTRKELQRLDRLRECFYIKAMEGQIDECKRSALLDLVKKWNWDEQKLELLDMRGGWKIKQAMLHQEMLVELLLQSYRNLIQFARKFHINPSILAQDTDVLMRKLYSIFEVVPGKIPLINRNIADNLSEDEVTFVEVCEGVSTKSGWYLVNHAPLSTYDSTTRHVQYQKNLTKLVAWAYFNGVITVTTQVYLVSQSIDLDTLRQFITDLRLHFPTEAPKMEFMDLYHPNEIRNLIVTVNLLKDPTRHLSASTKLDVSQINLFNLGSSEQGIIGQISIIYRNMWNEIMTQHFEGNDVALRALKFISNKIYRSSAPPKSVNVFSYSRLLRSELHKLVVELVGRCITVQTGSIFQRLPSQTLQVIGKKWHLVFDSHLALKDIIQEDENVTRKELIVPREICNFASEGFLQFFFEDNQDGSFQVYVLDKQNHVECYYCDGDKENKVKQLSLLYARNNEGQDNIGSFNFPQFYQLLKQNDAITIVPFQSRQHREYLALQQNSL
ncbi:adenylate cyclase [Pasteurellaceae bacterium 15-036681]|nr:adenylate cyclase [Pasteurellaceae bacterium 15-036681]